MYRLAPDAKPSLTLPPRQKRRQPRDSLTPSAGFRCSFDRQDDEVFSETMKTAIHQGDVHRRREEEEGEEEEGEEEEEEEEEDMTEN